MIQEPLALNDKAIQILQGAMQEFLHYGYAGTSMDRVATTAGVSKPTVYSYFQDKEGLFQALIKYIAQTRCEQIVGGDAMQGPPEAVLRRLVTKAMETEMHDLDYQNFMRLVVGESGRFPHLAQAFVEHLTKTAVNQLTDYLQSHPELNLLDTEATARIVVGSVVFFILSQRIMHGDQIMPMEPERLVDSLVHLVTQSQSPPS